MRIPSRITAALFASLSLLTITLQAVFIGQSRDDLIYEIGMPSSQASLGGKEILKFSNGATINIEDGKVTKVTGMHYDLNIGEQMGLDVGEFQPRVEKNIVVKDEPKPDPESVSDEAAAQPTADSKASDVTLEVPDESSQIIEQFSKSPEEMAADYGYDESDYDYEEPAEPTLMDKALGFAFWAVIHVVVMVILISILASQTGIEFFMRDRIILACIHAALYIGCDLLMNSIFGMSSPYLAHGIGFFLFYILLPRFSSAREATTLISLSLGLTIGWVLMKMLIGFIIAMTTLSFLRSVM